MKPVPAGSTETTTRSEPWYPQQEPYKYGFREARNIYEAQRGTLPYPQFSGVAPFTPEQLIGQGMATGYAMEGLPSFLGDVFSAEQFALNPFMNPWLGAYGQAAPVTSGAMTNYMLQGLSPEMAPEQAALFLSQPDYSGPLGAITERGLNTSLTPEIQSMLTTTPQMDVWGPLFEQVAGKGAETFTEKIAPVLRQEAMLSGNRGTPREMLRTQNVLGDVAEEVQRSMERLAQAAGSETLRQRGLGAQLATTLRGEQMGLGTQAAKALSQEALSRQLTGAQLAQREREAQRQAGTRAGEILTSGLGDLYSPTMTTFRTSLAAAPGIAEMGLMPSKIMSGVGGEIQAQNQRWLDELVNRFYQEQQAPWDRLNQYMNIIGAPLGTTAVSQQPYYWNPMGTLMGGMALAGVGPFAAAGGAEAAAGGINPWMMLPLLLM